MPPSYTLIEHVFHSMPHEMPIFLVINQQAISCLVLKQKVIVEPPLTGVNLQVFMIYKTKVKYDLQIKILKIEKQNIILQKERKMF